eukprot:INCI4906.1.p1 GENE.INCI4906.1~~INCI4906.1.p1  ORF type:complete len:457 (-),score=127.85 INCI4906.1:157-1404(-)
MSETAEVLLDLINLGKQAQTSTCRRLLEDQKLALQPTLIEQLLAENARFPPDVADSADTRGGASAEDGDEDEDSEDNDAPPLPKPAAGSGDEDDNATGSNNSSAAAATSSTSHVVSKSVSSASSSSGANRTPAATPDSAEVTVLANALTAFYKAVGADKSRADAERSARMFAGDLKKRQLAFETLQQRYESSDPSGAAIKELQNHFFPGRQNAVGASTEPAKTPASSSAAAGAKKISASPAPAPVAVVASAGPVPFTIISKFAWSQSEKFVSVHFDRPGCSSLPKDQASVQFTETTAELRVYDKPVDQASVLERHRWRVPNLCHPIDPSKSKLVWKTDRLVVKMKKQENGIEWSDLTDTLDKKKALRERRIANGDLKGASTQELLADMFANASDEERKGLLEAAHKGRQKREGAE